MPTLNMRCDDTVITLLVQLQHAGFGKNRTEVVLSALDLLSESSLLDVAKARMAKLERAADQAKAAPAVEAPVFVPVVISPPEPACEICGEPKAARNSRYCEAHIPPMED